MSVCDNLRFRTHADVSYECRIILSESVQCAFYLTEVNVPSYTANLVFFTPVYSPPDCWMSLSRTTFEEKGAEAVARGHKPRQGRKAPF